jgi:hypothetical protein
MSNPITLEEVEETLDLANRLGLIVRCPPGRGQWYTATPFSSDNADKLGSRSPQ